MYGNSEDEYRCVGPTGPGAGFKFVLNDADGFTRSANNRTSMGRPGRSAGDGPGSIFSMLLRENHPDYRILLADRIQELFFNDGPMTPAKMRTRLLERCDQVCTIPSVGAVTSLNVAVAAGILLSTLTR